MKKLLVILAIVMCITLVFVACSKNEPDDNSDYETTNKPTEVTTDETSEDTSGDATTEEDTTEKVTEVATADPTEVAELVSKVENIMNSIERIQVVDTITLFVDNSHVFTDTTTSIYDGFYGYVCNKDGDEVYEEFYYMCDALHYIYGEADTQGAVMLLSKSESEHLVSEYFSFGNELSEAASHFNNASITVENGISTLTFFNPTEAFANKIAIEFGDDCSIPNISASYSIDEGYMVTGFAMKIEVTVSGANVVSTTESAYTYDVEDITPPTECFDGYTVVEFEDVFGYIDTSYGADLGLDIDGDNFVIDYANLERCAKQLEFVDTYIDLFVGKNFTLYGAVETFNGQGYLVINNLPTCIVNININAELVCLKGSFDSTGAFDVAEYTVITESDIPEGGYLPWTAYVTAKSLNVRSSADFSSGANNKVGVLNQNTEVKVVGFIPDRYCMIEYHWETADGQSGEYAFVSLAYLSKLPAYYITLDENYKPVNAPV